MAISLTTACAQQPSTLANPGENPEEVTQEERYFNENVKPAFEASCSMCHADAQDHYAAPDFLGAAPEEYYDNLVIRTDFVSCNVDNSMLLLKGADPNHAGVALAPTDAPKVREWLEMEATARFGGVCSSPQEPPQPPDPTGGSPPPPEEGPLTGLTAMEIFGECMTYTGWVNNGMPLIAMQTSSYNGNQVACIQCHTNPNTGLNHMPDPNIESAVMDAFESKRHIYAAFVEYRFTVNDEDGSFRDIVPSYRVRDKGKDGSDHPQYELDANYLASYEAWFAEVKASYDNAIATGVRCDPAAGDPPPAP